MSREFDELFDQSDKHGGSVLLAIVTGVLQFNDRTFGERFTEVTEGERRDRSRFRRSRERRAPCDRSGATAALSVHQSNQRSARSQALFGVQIVNPRFGHVPSRIRAVTPTSSH